MNKIRSFIIASALLPCVSALAANTVKEGKDIKSGLDYKVDIDDANIKIEFGFSGHLRLMQVIENGFSVYINENGKKKTDMGLVIKGTGRKRPNDKSEHPEGGDHPRELPRQEGEASAKSQDKQDIRKPEPRKESFKSGFWKSSPKDSVLIDLTQRESGIIAGFEISNENNKCIINIPIEYVNSKGLSKPGKLAVGFISENSFSGMPDMNKRGVSQSDSEDGFGAETGGGNFNGNGMGGGFGGPGGGAPGGGPGGGGPGGPGGRPGGQQRSASQASNEIKLWIK